LKHIFTTWDQVVMLDLTDIGIDVEQSWDRPWWWLRAHILGLLDKNTRLSRTVQKLIS